MMCRARSSLGTGRSRSAAANCRDCAMWPVESTTVPSQSNISRSKRLPMASIGRFGFSRGLALAQEALEILRERGADLAALAADRMSELNALRVQKHASETLLVERFVQGEIAILVVASDRIAQMGKMDADLMCAPGE